MRNDINLEYSYVEMGDSEVGLNNLSIEGKVLETAVLKDKGVMSLRYFYGFFRMDYEDQSLDQKDLRNFHNVGLSLNFIKPINVKWSYSISLIPQFNSNFAHGIRGDDAHFTGLSLLNYRGSELSRVSFGFGYSTLFDFDLPFPFFNYWRQLGEKTDLNLGIPENYIRYSFTDRTNISAFLEFEFYNHNLSRGAEFDISRADQLIYNSFNTGFEITHKINFLEVTVSSGYIVQRTSEFTDESFNEVRALRARNNLLFSINLGFIFNQTDN